MKKLIALTLALLMLAMSLVACQPAANGGESTPESTPAETPAASEPAESEPAETEPENKVTFNNATELLTLVWNAMPDVINDGGTPDITEDDLNKNGPAEAPNFVGGLSFDAEGFMEQVSDMPGDFVLEAETINASLGFPADQIEKIDNASSIMFMMNQNTFTCGAYHVTNSADVDALVTAIEESIQGRWWMCGFPEKVIVIKVPGDYLVSIFGHTIVDSFVETFLATVEGAEVVLDNPIR